VPAHNNNSGMFAARQWKFLFKTFTSFKRQAPFKTFEQTMAITFDIFRNAKPATLLQVNSRQKRSIFGREHQDEIGKAVQCGHPASIWRVCAAAGVKAYAAEFTGENDALRRRKPLSEP
jgi:hypothetical protein